MPELSAAAVSAWRALAKKAHSSPERDGAWLTPKFQQALDVHLERCREERRAAAKAQAEWDAGTRKKAAEDRVAHDQQHRAEEPIQVEQPEPEAREATLQKARAAQAVDLAAARARAQAAKGRERDGVFTIHFISSGHTA